MSEERVLLAHGSGGLESRRLIVEEILPLFPHPALAPLEDSAKLLLEGAALAFTTDSYVVDPIFFPGGDIGSLSIHGTVNDLAVAGARPLYLSAGLILEEGFPLADLRRVLRSMARAAEEAGVALVAGDTKVVAAGAADQIFISTAGIGALIPGIQLSAAGARPGDRVLVSGPVGDHGAAILLARGAPALCGSVLSDSAPLAGLVSELLQACPGVRAMRDPTRGGLASVLDELARASRVTAHIEEAAIPVRDEVRAVSELLGLDPYHLACEGRLVAVVPEAVAAAALAAVRRHPQGREAALIGELGEGRPRVILHTTSGGERIVQALSGEQLPRIC